MEDWDTHNSSPVATRSTCQHLMASDAVGNMAVRGDAHDASSLSGVDIPA
jgi:hypothetical protein